MIADMLEIKARKRLISSEKLEITPEVRTGEFVENVLVHTKSR